MAHAVDLRNRFSHWRVPISALAVAAMGIYNLLSAMMPALAGRLMLLHSIMPIEVRQGAKLATTVSGIALLVLARSLWRRKRVAWLLTIGWLAVAAVSHMAKGLDYEEALAALILMAWLLWLRRDFAALSDPPSMRQGLVALALSFVFTLSYGTLGFFLLDKHYHETFTLPAALEQTTLMFVQMDDPGLHPITGAGRYFADSIYFVALGTLAYALWMLLMPVLLRAPASAQERQRARQIVSAYGRSTLARFTLFEDKSYFFAGAPARAAEPATPGEMDHPGEAVIAFVVRNGVALALGDPIGPDAAIAAAIAGWARDCRQRDWIPAFYQTSDAYADLYRSAGFQLLCIGREGIVDLHTFTLQGSANKNFRTTLNRYARESYRAEMLAPPIHRAVMDELHEVSDEWLAERGGAEMRFSMGWFNPAYVRDSQVMAVYAPDGRITAFANLVPAYQSDVVGIDLMRRREVTEPGTMDFLFLSLIQWAKEAGYAGLSLGLSALAGVGDAPSDPAVERALHYLYEHPNSFYNFGGLHAYKQKFGPALLPRYLVYPTPVLLPNVLLAVALANTGRRTLREMIAGQRLLRPSAPIREAHGFG